ncbi:non-ribosomal peptide synthetase [Chitinophaga sp. S165]|uniref:non-ribosomal peptide synthetase n=1 Tax=Chitinophaga sp. S165 TaxID=2135462 RepID=UPI000D710344|nr:non-ribosomal peptide synthetase [Chitinophaga sp. S165]PWV46103.1 amino acid adenylation domain-containing protein [Chitinophaga sp. S165]
MKESISNRMVLGHWENLSFSGLFTDIITPFRRFTAVDNSTGEKTVTIPLPAELVAGIARLCNSSDLLIYNFYTSALGLLLSRYCQRNALLMITPSLCKTSLSADHYQYVQFNAEKGTSFKALFTKGKEQLPAAMDNAVEAATLRDFPAGMNITAEVGCVVSDITMPWGSFKPPVSIEIVLKEAPAVVVRFDAGQFYEDLLELLLLNYRRLLGSIVDNLYAPLEDLEFRSEEECKLQQKFNMPVHTFPTQKHMVAEIEECLAAMPEHIAIDFEGKRVSYRELNARANKIAHFLLNVHKVTRHDVVGVCMDRSDEMAAVILGIWKAGAAYVPVDPAYPDQRKEEIITNSNVKTVFENNLPAEIEDQPDNNPGVAVRMEDLAYVIYTSGTTGKPKGVMITHFGMRNHIGAKIADLHIGEGARIAQNAPHCFDISVWQFFAALVRKGTTCVYGNDVIMEPGAFMKKLSADGVNVLELVPSYFALMLDALDEPEADFAFPDLQCLLLQAEPLLPSMVKRWYRHFPEIVIYNAYGITETSDDIAHYRVSHQESTLTIPVAQGMIQHAHIYLVDEDLRPVPLGAKGEILVAGDCVGKGYHNNPEETAQRFLKGPIGRVTDQEKIYRSGDVARYLADGRLEFFGRKDAQVKIRGQRVEPGEIEVVMAAIEGVEHAVILPDPGNQRLLAYYTGAQLERDVLETALRAKLAEYMVPSVFIRVEKFPLTPNGKIDRKKLAAEAVDISTSLPEETGERDAITLRVTDIWKEVLKRPHIGLNEDFFHVGGTSLTVMKMAAVYSREFNVKLPVSLLFDRRTIKAHVEAITHTGSESWESIVKVPVQESYELSDAQRRLWILSRFGEGNVAYNVPLSVGLKGTLDIPVFRKAVRYIIRRHEILRTVFREDAAGVPKQHVVEDWDTDLEIFDLRQEQDLEKKAAAYRSQLLGHSFDMENGPLFKIWLLRLGDERFLCCFNMHHIICDGWSLDILANEVLSAYAGFLEGTAPDLPELLFQYKDYTAWQNKILNGPQLNRHRDYWLNALSGDLPVLDLPTCRPRPAVKTYNGGKVHFELPSATLQALEAFCRNQNSTPYVGLLSVIYALLSRYTGQNDIILGGPVAGREHPELHNQVGFYVNTLPLRVRIDGSRNFYTLFADVRKTVEQALQHQVYPFDLLVDDLKLERQTSRSPLFDVTVVLEGATGKNTLQETGSTLELGYLKEEQPHAKFDLNIMFNDTGAGMQVAITFNSDLFEKPFVERMAAHMLQLMEKVLADSNIALDKIDYLTPAERAQLLAVPVQSAYASVSNVITHFEEYVHTSPDAVAVAFGEQQLTYRELNERANYIAHALLERKTGNDAFVAIYLERGIAYVCAILGILKAGAAYVPLDVNWPIERTRYVLEDSGAGIIISTNNWLEGLTQEEINNCLVLDHHFSDLPDAWRFGPRIELSDADTAYVIYTSGTTGNPKGVLVSHGNLTALLDAAQIKFDFGPQDVWTLFHSFCFDFSVWELWGPLSSGGRVVVIPEALARDTIQFAELLAAEGVTVLNQTPSAFYALTEVLKNDGGISLPQMRYLIFGGEALHPGRLQWWKENYPAVRNINMYGITETTVHVTFKDIGEAEIRNNTSAIGRPLPQWSCYILDQHQLPVPVGISGELYVGGPAVAKGYHNRKELTAQRFVELSAIPGARLYRSGDKVKLREDGELEFISRLDNQVKVRGYRIELGEIENTLLKSGSFTDVKVRAVNIGEEVELAAYYTANTPVEVAACRTYLRKSLPHYMVPAYFVRLDKMPVTSNGKLDEKALARIEPGERMAMTTFVPPSNETEIKLAGIWKNILNIENVGIHDNFFEIGGHSLKATMLLAEIHKTFNIKLKLEDIFSDPTIAGLSTLIQHIEGLLSPGAVNGRRKIII